MRTTVDLDEDILKVAKDLAEERAQSLGPVLSDLVRQGLQPTGDPKIRGGVIPTLPRKLNARPVTMQAVNDLAESEV